MRKALLLLAALCLLVPFAARAEGDTVTLSFVGDCSIGEALRYRSAGGSYTNTLDKNGPEWPFSLVRDLLEADDYTFANLEVVFTNKKITTEKKLTLCGPRRNAEVLKHSGIDAVNTVNNHCFDVLVDGYLDTMETLDDLGFPHFGTSFRDRTKPQLDILLNTEAGGLRIGAVGFAFPEKESDYKAIGQRIDRLREEGCKLVIVSLHWGTERHTQPDRLQPTMAKRIFDLGADVIWGHHPHILQPIQMYEGKVVMYSTGNFTFGTMHSAVDPDTGIFRLTYRLDDDGSPDLKEIRVIPCVNGAYGDYRPSELTGEEERRRVFQKLIYKGKDHGLINMPASFLETGVAKIRDGIPAE